MARNPKFNPTKVKAGDKLYVIFTGSNLSGPTPQIIGKLELRIKELIVMDWKSVLHMNPKGRVISWYGKLQDEDGNAYNFDPGSINSTFHSHKTAILAMTERLEQMGQELDAHMQRQDQYKGLYLV